MPRFENHLILGNRFRVPKLNPFFYESRFEGGGGLEIATRRFEAMRSHVMNFFFVLRIDARCDLPDHLWESLNGGSQIRGGEKTNKHKQLCGIVPEMGGGQIVYVFPFFLGQKGNT